MVSPAWEHTTILDTFYFRCAGTMSNYSKKAFAHFFGIRGCQFLQMKVPSNYLGKKCELSHFASRQKEHFLI
jgi:hypothetical protein